MGFNLWQCKYLGLQRVDKWICIWP